MNPNITQIIEQYLQNELSTEDKIAFEKRLSENTKLKEEVLFQKTIHEAAKRTSIRVDIKKIAHKYHSSKLMKWGGLSLAVIAILTASTFFLLTLRENNQKQLPPIPDDVKKKIENKNLIEDLSTQLFQIPEEGTIVLSKEGVLISAPKGAFLMNGKVYHGNAIIKFQEALNAQSIIKSGLSTMSGDRLLETQGMISFEAFTPNGKRLDINPKVGVYMQVPVDEYKKGMQLFDGVKLPDGTIDWQNPEKLEKIPVLASMNELDFYPVGYEAHLDKIKWSKKKRDSLYLSFEEETLSLNEISDSNLTEEALAFPSHRKITIEDSTETETIYEDVAISEGVAISEEAKVQNYISPSKVLAFWKPKFNNTNLSTRDFEKRMRAIHSTCNDAVLKKYTSQLSKSISQIDREVVAMGYSEFKSFALENVGAVNPNNPHTKALGKFYQDGISDLKNQAKKNAEKERKRKNKWDNKVQNERTKESARKIKRENEALQEEYKFNMRNVKKQIGRTIGFTLKHSPRGTIKNIDAYVWEATVNRTSMDRIDPVSGKRVKITYNDFSFSVPNANKYIKLYAYLFPHELKSYQRINGENGKFNYPLNDDILYDIGIVGITEDGYEYFQKQTFKKGDLGEIRMKKVSEVRLNESILQLNNKRISKPMRIKNEMDWLLIERKNFLEQKRRQKMYQFRRGIRKVIFPCYIESEESYPVVIPVEIRE